MQNPKFLTRPTVLAIHQRQLQKFGGLEGIRDEGLLESALAQPQATFFGEFLHPNIFTQAAAYLYHLAKNHPFIDGNKRTAFATMVTFLSINGFSLNLSQDEAYALVMRVAQGEITKEEISIFLQGHLFSKY